MAALQAMFFILWLCALAFYAISAYSLRAFFIRERGRTPSSGGTPPLTVLKPIRGADGNTYENLKSFISQDYPRFQTIFGMAEESDPAVPVVRRLIAEHPDRDIVLVVSGRESGTNSKVSNLGNMYEKARYDILVIADSDMRVGPDYLRAVAAGFEDPSVGLVTCPYRGAYPKNLGAALDALTIDTDFLPSVAVAERLEGLSFALGATMAVRRDALEKIGGFAVLADRLADDYWLGNLVKQAGYGLKLAGYVVDSVEGRESFSGYFAHQLRWGRTYRVCRPKGYFLSVLTKGTVFSALFLLASGFSPAGWSVVLAELVIRSCQAAYMEGFYIKGPGVIRYFWLLPLKDLLGAAIWLLSFTGNTVTWKGASFRIDREGRMERL